MVFIIILSNLVVGSLIGISGIAGFLLPLIYVSVLDIPLRDALAISFLSFMVGGIFGSYSYWKSKNIDFNFATFLNIGSILGAILGVKLNIMIPVNIAKLFLYLVVFLSGISILLRQTSNTNDNEMSNPLLNNKSFIVFLGFITGTICALTGAGGPILVVPILTLLGINIRTAVGIGIFNQIIIALPSSIGYFSQSNLKGIMSIVTSSIISHIIGIVFGTKISQKINVTLLKFIVSLLSIISSLYLLLSTI